MEGLFYSYEHAGYPAIHLLRFYETSGYVLAQVVSGDRIDDVPKMLRKFAMENHKLQGEPEYVFAGAYQENGNRLQFKIENEIRSSSETWAKYDLLHFKGEIVSPGELTLRVTSKTTGKTVERTYYKATGTTIIPAEKPNP